MINEATVYLWEADMSEVKETDKRVRGADNNCDYISFKSAPHSHFICELKKKNMW